MTTKESEVDVVSQQALHPQFANTEALADWLESLHEAYPDGSVGNRKWEPAQVAAKAVRATLRPNPERGVTEARVDGLMQLAREWCLSWGEWAHDNDPGCEKENAAEARLRAALEAALAAEPAAQGESCRDVLEGGIFISGPKASAVVFDSEHTETVIHALCEETEDDPDDYTATKLTAPPAQPADSKVISADSQIKPERVPEGMVLVPAEASDADAFMVLYEYQQPGRTRKDAYRIAIRKLAERAAPSPARGDGGEG